MQQNIKKIKADYFFKHATYLQDEPVHILQTMHQDKYNV
jgi:hypothetical protein